jgi:hypothetical protein
MRAALPNQDVAYFLLNAFTISEPSIYFWEFRGYEIAVQSKLKWFIFSGTSSRQREHGYHEKYRNSHNASHEHLSERLMTRDPNILPWTILTSGIYAGVISALLLPRKRPDGVYEFAAPLAPAPSPYSHSTTTASALAGSSNTLSRLSENTSPARAIRDHVSRARGGLQGRDGQGSDLH